MSKNRVINSTESHFPQLLLKDVMSHPRGYFHIRRSGGLGPDINFREKFGARSGQGHQIRGKTWEVL